MWGKKAMLDRRVPHRIHGGDSADNRGARKVHEIQRRNTRKIDLWAIEQYVDLSANTVVEIQYLLDSTTQYNEETNARTINSKNLYCNIQAAVRGIRGHGHSGVLLPGDADTKTGRPFMEVLRDKHPMMRIPDLSDPECSSFEEYEKEPDALPL